jgi:hypothetical protein
MKVMSTVREMMSFVKDGDSKWVTLITACSNEEVYSDFYFNFPYEMKELDITLIELQQGYIVLYVL